MKAMLAAIGMMGMFGLMGSSATAMAASRAVLPLACPATQDVIASSLCAQIRQALKRATPSIQTRPHVNAPAYLALDITEITATSLFARLSWHPSTGDVIHGPPRGLRVSDAQLQPQMLRALADDLVARSGFDFHALARTPARQEKN